MYILPYIEQNGLYFYGFLFVIAIAESTPIIGTFAPGSLVLILFGFLAVQGYGHIEIQIIVATIGAIIGETAGYMVGRYGKGWLRDNKGIFKYSQLETAKKYFINHGGKSVCFGRFIGPLRPVISIFAGASEMSFYRFFWWNVLGSFLWSALYLVLGFVFGAHWRIIEKIGARVGLALTVIIIGVAYLYLTRKKPNSADVSEPTSL
jgi:undecaprenyl-diphosphatase